MKIYLLGQISLANRGCEALVRSLSLMIRERFPGAQLFCPSENAELDLRQWPNAAEDGINFVGMPSFPTTLKIWGRLFRAVPPVRRLGVLPFSLPTEAQKQIQSADAVVMTGGDIISLDYGLNPLYFWSGLADAAHRLKKPTHLLAASVGPFSKDPLTEKHMIAHLRRYTSISVRETATLDYLKRLGLPDVRLVADPAFVLRAAPIDVSDFINPETDYIGLNVSPLVRKVLTDKASRQRFDYAIRRFIRVIVTESDNNVVLIPHVDPLAGEWENSDRAYMRLLHRDLTDLGSRVSMTPDLLNAAQIKHVIGRCRYFIGARTHATIAAISQGVPTLSLAYSVKALGINKDLFGSTRYVLSISDISTETLCTGLALLRSDEAAFKAVVAEKLPLWQARAREALAVL